MTQSAHDAGLPDLPRQAGVDFVRVRFAGDSGDGVQTTGALFTQSAADFGNDFATFPDFPAEIRAPAGTTAGVSAYSLNVGSGTIYTHGDQPDVLVAFNAAALAMHRKSLDPGGLLLLDSSGMTPRLIQKAGFDGDPRDDGTLDGIEVIELDISNLTLAATQGFGLTRKQALRARNMWALGLTLWLFARDEEPVAFAIAKRFAGKPEVAEANLAALRAGHAHGETHELAVSGPRYDIAPAPLPTGLYRAASGSEALTLGVIAASRLAGLPLFYASYPITPASPILHRLAALQAPDVTVFQAEDEIAAASAAIGAAFGGCLATTASSGPGLALMTEAMGLAIAAELPLLVIDVQRAGPLHRNADQDRAVGPPLCSRRAQRGHSPAGSRREEPVGLLSHGNRGGAHRDSPHDSRHPARRRLSRECGSSLASAGQGWAGSGAPGAQHSAECRRRSSLPPRSEDFGTRLASARNAGPGTSGRRTRARCRLGPGLLRSGKPPAHDRDSLWQDRPHPGRSSGHHARDRQRFGTARRSRLGLHLRRDPRRHPACPRPRYRCRPHPSSSPLTHASKSRDPARRLRKGSSSRVEHGAARIASARGDAGQCRAASQGGRTALPCAGNQLGNSGGVAAMSTVRNARDFDPGQQVRWCPGCGDYAILKAVRQALADADAEPHRTAFVSGIGCAARLPYYVNSYGFHTVHGRAPAVATGLKLARPDLDVWVITGDGDGLSIGAGHLHHVLRRNTDLQILLFNNRIYGLTKGQASPTSPAGLRTASTPLGAPDTASSPCRFALGSGARFVAREIDINQSQLKGVFGAARAFRGAAFVEILQNCPIYNDGTFAALSDRKTGEDAVLRVRHGEPLVFGTGRNRGIRLRPGSLLPEVVEFDPGGSGCDSWASPPRRARSAPRHASRVTRGSGIPGSARRAAPARGSNRYRRRASTPAEPLGAHREHPRSAPRCPHLADSVTARARALLIAGPTAAGKSALASRLARELGGAVINADSMQVYREWRILTARPTESECRAVPHRLYGHASIRESYSVASGSATCGRHSPNLKRSGCSPSWSAARERISGR